MDTTDNSLYKSLVHQTAILKQLDSFRASGTFCDVTIGAGGKTFKCHRVLLAASSTYFESLFLLGQQMHPDYVTFVPLVSASSFEEILRFMYMAEFTISPENANDLLEAATMLRIQPMKEAVSHYLRSYQQGTTSSGVTGSHTERTTGHKRKRDLPETESRPRQEEDLRPDRDVPRLKPSSESVKKSKLGEKTRSNVGETSTNNTQPGVPTQQKVGSYRSNDRQHVSEKIYPEACTFTNTSPSPQYDQGATITVKQEKEDPGYDVAMNSKGSVGVTGDQRELGLETSVRPDGRDKERVHWTMNRQSPDDDGTINVPVNDKPDTFSVRESAKEKSLPTSTRTAENTTATHGRITNVVSLYQQPFTSESFASNIKQEPGTVIAEKNGASYGLQVQHGVCEADGREETRERSHANLSPATSTEGSTGESVGLSAAELLKTLSRRYESAKQQMGQETTDTESPSSLGVGASPRPQEDGMTESALFSSWQAQPQITTTDNTQPLPFQTVGSDLTRFVAPRCLGHQSPEARLGSQRSVRTTVGSATLSTLLASSSSTYLDLLASTADNERAERTALATSTARRDPTDHNRTTRLAASLAHPQTTQHQQQRGSPKVFGQADSTCVADLTEGSTLRGRAHRRGAEGRLHVERTPRRAGLRARKPIHKILTRLLSRDPDQDMEEDSGNVSDDKPAAEEWKGTGASQALRSMCGEYLTSTLPQQSSEGSGECGAEARSRDDTYEVEGTRPSVALTFKESTTQGDVPSGVTVKSESVDDDEVNFSSMLTSSGRESRVSSSSTGTRYPTTDQSTDSLSATPRREHSELVARAEGTAELTEDTQWLTASETLRRISGTRTWTPGVLHSLPEQDAGSAAGTRDDGTATGTGGDTKTPRAVQGSSAGRNNQATPGYKTGQAQQATELGRKKNGGTSGYASPGMRQLHQTLGRVGNVGERTVDEGSTRPEMFPRTETERQLLEAFKSEQRSTVAQRHTTQHSKYKDYAACDILKSMIRHHGQGSQDQPPH